jgi:hypothetical protein
MDMQFHWLRDPEAQGQFRIYWRLGGTNLVDYFTKHHPLAHHVNVRAEFLTRVKDHTEARHMRHTGQTKNSSNKIATLQWCVRQASIQKLVQQIFSEGENLNSLPEGFWNDNRKVFKVTTISLDS